MYAGGGVLGGADALALTDVGSGIWEGSALLNGSNGGNFAFFNSPAHGSDWGTKENLTGLSCADPGNYNDRILPTFTRTPRFYSVSVLVKQTERVLLLLHLVT